MGRVKMMIRGKVQGVFFRARAKEKAEELNLEGWIENKEDGSVYVVAEGEEDALVFFVEWCKDGPPFAKIEGIDVEWGKAEGEYKGFSIR